MAWLDRWSPRPSARLRLVCLPSAGGSATAYRRWTARMPDGVELVAVELPGHGRRHREPAVTVMTELVRGVLTELAPLLTRPVAVFGHSMGALLGLELAREIRRRTGRPPAALLVSSIDAPRVGAEPGGPTGARGTPAGHPDDYWADTLRQLGGVDEDTAADPRLMELLTAALRGDLALLAGYRYRVEEPLGCPVRVYAGSADREVTAGGLAAWRRESPADFAVSRLPGGHFFLREHEQLFHARLCDDLARIRVTAATNGVIR